MVLIRSGRLARYADLATEVGVHETSAFLDTPAGRQAVWRLEHMAEGDRDLTAEEVVEHFDAHMLQGQTVEQFIATRREFSMRIGSFEIAEARADSAFKAVVTLAATSGKRWLWSCVVSNDAPHRIVTMACVLPDDEAPGEVGPHVPIVHCVDHFYVPLADGRSAFDFLTDTLGLPAAWPWSLWGNSGEFGNAGAELGNAQLELMTFPLGGWSVPQTPARVQCILFEPPPIDDAFVAELSRRRVPHEAPRTAGTSIAGGGTYTLVAIAGLIHTSDSGAYFCRYHHSAARDRVARQAALDACGGGDLGVTGVVELVIESSRWQTHVDRWQRLLDPLAPVGPGYWKVGDGPAIRLVKGDEDAVNRVVLGVRSLEHAQSQLDGLHLASTETTEGLRVELEQLNGLDVRLVAAAPGLSNDLRRFGDTAG